MEAPALKDEHTYEASHIHTCDRCGVRYDWRKSTSSSLKMTYCGNLCEQGALGFTIEALLRLEISRGESSPIELPARALATA